MAARVPPVAMLVEPAADAADDSCDVDGELRLGEFNRSHRLSRPSPEPAAAERPKADWRDFLGRFREVVSDPNNQRIRRVPLAGFLLRDASTDSPFVVMHNGLRVPLDSYYGEFGRILVINRGVHEPQEEFIFSRVLEAVTPGESMVELGAYWAFYSAWLKSRHPASRVYMVEPEATHLECGRRTFALNGLEGRFILDGIRPGGLRVGDLLRVEGIDRLGILHADIQGSEEHLLRSEEAFFAEHRARFVFVSTHSQQLHLDCRGILEGHGYRVIGSADFERETFCLDGVLVCAAPDVDFEPIDLLCRARGDAIDTVGFE